MTENLDIKYSKAFPLCGIFSLLATYYIETEPENFNQLYNFEYFKNSTKIFDNIFY